MKKLILAVAVLLGLTACTDKNQQMTKLAEMSLRQSIGEGNDVKITGISEPDSAFGSNYLTPEEKKAVIGTMKKVTDQIMPGRRCATDPRHRRTTPWDAGRKPMGPASNSGHGG